MESAMISGSFGRAIIAPDICSGDLLSVFARTAGVL
jgi:hypothetical protein